MSRTLLGKDRKLSAFQVVLLACAIAFGFAVVIYFSNFRVPEVEP